MRTCRARPSETARHADITGGQAGVVDGGPDRFHGEVQPGNAGATADSGNADAGNDRVFFEKAHLPSIQKTNPLPTNPRQLSVLYCPCQSRRRLSCSSSTATTADTGSIPRPAHAATAAAR